MKTRLSLLLIAFLLLAGCSPGAPEAATADLPTATEEAPQATATRKATAEVATPIVVTVIPGATSLPLDEITPPPEATWDPGTAVPTVAGGLGPAALKYIVLEAYPNHFYCDPDEYPVAIGDEAALAVERFPAIQANEEEFAAIVAFLEMTDQTTFSDADKLLVYREHKRLAAVQFEPAGDGYRFTLQVQEAAEQGATITGFISGDGAISAVEETPGIVMCPICLAAGTRIATPRGPVAVEALRPGDVVWTVGAGGGRIAAPLLAVGHTLAPAMHEVIRVTLDDGRTLSVSAGHPTAAGRPVGDLRLGDALDGGRVVGLARLPYGGRATYDLLPSGPTGIYWADGILLGSTLGGPEPAG
jgi:hypothetical protein